jgi:hypothetical protein
MTEWDPEVHGQEVGEELEADDCPDQYAIVSWRPGEYSFSTGCAQSYDFRVPEAVNAPHPSQAVLRGIHEFLKVTYDE